LVWICFIKKAAASKLVSYTLAESSNDHIILGPVCLADINFERTGSMNFKYPVRFTITTCGDSGVLGISIIVKLDPWLDSVVFVRCTFLRKADIEVTVLIP